MIEPATCDAGHSNSQEIDAETQQGALALKRHVKRISLMSKTLSALGLAAGLALLSGAAFAEQGNSSSWGTVGWGPVIPTQSLTPKERDWNFDNQAKYEAENSAEWLRQHGRGLFPFFQ
jgi:hypothetical protein